jgi:two-component system CitB family sensor kinase
VGAEAQPWVEVDLRLEADETLLIRVADSGPGVPPDARESVFEPGWTTKPSRGIGARGVGLSLGQTTAAGHAPALRPSG